MSKLSTLFKKKLREYCGFYDLHEALEMLRKELLGVCSTEKQASSSPDKVLSGEIIKGERATNGLVCEKVEKCDLCGEKTFQHLQKFRSREFDGTLAFYKKYPEENPFVHIHESHNLMQCERCRLVFVSPRIKDWVVNRWYDEYLSGKYREFIIEYDQSGREDNFTRYLELIEQFALRGGGIFLILDVPVVVF